MIQPLDTASSPEVSKQSSATPAVGNGTGGTAYSSVHAAAVARDKPSASAAAKTTSPRRERMTVPDGETWEATKPGAHYARIVTGPRKGEFINLTHGARRGETFTIQQRDGKTLHVYTKSGQEVLVQPSTDASDVTPAAKHVKHPPHDLPPKGEQWAPVAGANYADILGGARNGMYVNISGGIRDGMAFQVVKKGGKWFHVYGTGKDRQWIPSDGPKHKTTHAPSSSSGTGGTGGTASDNAADAVAGGTGGTAPPSAA